MFRVLVGIGMGAVLLFPAAPAMAQAANAADTAAMAKKHYDGGMADVFKPGLAKGETGEGLCWRAGFSMHTFPRGYQAFGDVAFIEQGLKFCDALVDAMAEGPDGYRGWIGPYMYDANFWCDAHVGDAVVADGLLDLAEVILKDDALKAKYGAKAQSYVDLVRKNVIEKWDARGTWKEDPPYGGYVGWNRYGKAGQFKDWEKPAGVHATDSSLPFNKQEHVGTVLLKLFRITGEKAFREKAEKIFAFSKSRFQFYDDHYLWNYWEPMGPWDVDLDKKLPRHWINVHPFSNYQQAEVSMIVEAYHTGVVFDKTDMQRILNTNLKVMWNQDLAKPAFENSNCTLPNYVKPKPGYGFTTLAGTLWDSLADFDPTVRKLLAAMHKVDNANPLQAVNWEYFQKVTCKDEPSFRRKSSAEPNDLPAFSFSECKTLNAAMALPTNVSQKVILLSKTSAAGEVEVALYSADGKNPLEVLHKETVQGGMDNEQGLVIFEWDGSPAAAGKAYDGPYRIRWTMLGQYREQPIVIHVRK